MMGVLSPRGPLLALPPLWTGLFMFNAAEVWPEIGTFDGARAIQGPALQLLAIARGFAASATSQEAFPVVAWGHTQSRRYATRPAFNSIATTSPINGRPEQRLRETV
jgi:hypothetical protein